MLEWPEPSSLCEGWQCQTKIVYGAMQSMLLQWPENDIAQVQAMLRSLDLSKNKLPDIPSSIGQLAAVKTINLSENTIG